MSLPSAAFAMPTKLLGRGKPRWSVLSPNELPLSMAGLPSSNAWVMVGPPFSGSLVKSLITRASIAFGTEALRFVGRSGGSMTCFMAVASGPSAVKGTVPVSIS